jgi:formate dehydrogenase major subunit
LPLPGDARLDIDIIQELANRLGCNWSYPDVGAVYTEMASTKPSLKNISWDRLVREGAVTYPTDGTDMPGNEIIFSAGFPTKSGRGKIVPANVLPPGRGVPIRALNRTRARALAYRGDDAPVGRAG